MSEVRRHDARRQLAATRFFIVLFVLTGVEVTTLVLVGSAAAIVLCIRYLAAVFGSHP
jgi:hypothetical protein